MNINQHKFITEYLRHRSAYTAYCIAYKVEDETQYENIMREAHHLLDDPDVGGVIRSVLEGARYEAEQQVRAEMKIDVLTIQRKREILARIANGEMYIAQNYKGKDCTQCTQMVTPTINQMLKAIDLDNKMAGHYSINKEKTQQFTTNREVPLLAKEGTLESASRHEPTGVVDSREGQQNTTNRNNLVKRSRCNQLKRQQFCNKTQQFKKKKKPPEFIPQQAGGVGVQEVSLSLGEGRGEANC